MSDTPIADAFDKYELPAPFIRNGILRDVHFTGARACLEQFKPFLEAYIKFKNCCLEDTHPDEVRMYEAYQSLQPLLKELEEK